MADHALLAQLIAAFNGAIKYEPMLQDHPDWSREQYLAAAREGHTRAIAGLKAAFERERAGGGNWHNPPNGTRAWNHGIPYCRNLPTTSMIEEALK